MKFWLPTVNFFDESQKPDAQPQKKAPAKKKEPEKPRELWVGFVMDDEMIQLKEVYGPEALDEALEEAHAEMMQRLGRLP